MSWFVCRLVSFSPKSAMLCGPDLYRSQEVRQAVEAEQLPSLPLSLPPGMQAYPHLAGVWREFIFMCFRQSEFSGGPGGREPSRYKQPGGSGGGGSSPGKQPGERRRGGGSLPGKEAGGFGGRELPRDGPTGPKRKKEKPREVKQVAPHVGCPSMLPPSPLGGGGESWQLRPSARSSTRLLRTQLLRK